MIRLFLSVLCLFVVQGICLAAPAKVVFSRQVLPILQRECRSCHAGSAAPGGYRMETAEQLQAGGRHGVAVAPGQSGASALVKYLTGELKPQMPPGKPLSLETIALIRRWIDEGARIDGMALRPTNDQRPTTNDARPARGVRRFPRADALDPAPPPLTAVAAGAPLVVRRPAQRAPVTALAYSPDGKWLAAGGFQAVRLLDAGTGTIVRTLPGPSDQVQSLAWSADGRWLAAAGGLSGVYGEVCVWESAAWAKPQIRRGHADTITAVAWRPGTMELATGSMDKTVRIWRATPLHTIRTLKEHVDPVFAAAYSPDGQWLATGSGDRSVKLFQTGDYSRKATIPGHGDAVTALAFNAKGDALATACADRKVRLWPVTTGAIANPLRDHGEEEVITTLAFSRDGSHFIWGAANRKVRVWNGEVSERRHELEGATDWVYAVAASPDGKSAAAGDASGHVLLWSTDDGRLTHTIAIGPGTK